MKKKSNCLMRSFIVVMLLGLIVGSYPAFAEAEKTLKFTSTMKQVEMDYLPNCIGAQYFADNLPKRTEGKVAVRMFLDGVLGGSAEELIGGVQNGAFEMIALALGSWGDYTNAFAPMNIPYLFTNHDEVYAFLDGSIGNKMKEKCEKDTGIKILSFLDIGFRHVTNSKREIVAPDDMKGLKIRTMNDRNQIAAMRALGASPTPTSYAELYTALQQRVVDAQENPVFNIMSAKFYEVQKYLSLTSHSYTITALGISKALFDSLSPEIQTEIVRLGREAELKSREALTSKEADVLENLRKYMTVRALSDRELKAFQEKAKVSWTEIEKEKIGRAHV